MSRRCDGIKLPSYYIGPTRRPNGYSTGYIHPHEVFWDEMTFWQTTAEWLAWIRRRDGGKRYWRGKEVGWHYPVRPIIAAQRSPWTTLNRRMGRLP